MEEDHKGKVGGKIGHRRLENMHQVAFVTASFNPREINVGRMETNRA